MRRIVLLYMPVVHRGYVDFLNEQALPDGECLLIGEAALRELGEPVAYVLRKDHAIRGLPEPLVRDIVRSLGLFQRVELLGTEVEPSPVLLSMPDEDVSRLAAARFFPKAAVCLSRTRLRYDRGSAERVDPVPATECTYEDLHRELMGNAAREAARSKDWWLPVGGVIARNGVPLLEGYNRAALDDDLPNILGDPRSAFGRGENTEDTLAQHIERDLVARAAYLGISLRDADAYVTHFPCVPCAESLAVAGVRRIFFSKGYSRLESAELLAARGVEMIRVV